MMRRQLTLFILTVYRRQNTDDKDSLCRLRRDGCIDGGECPRPEQSTNLHKRRAYIGGGSYSLSTTAGTGTAQDPDGAGYLRPYFHGSLGWPASGAMINGGLFAGEHWSIRR
jgi:hypothetical protein